MVRLEIGTFDNIGIFENIPVSITYQITDVRQPENRKGSLSKTIRIPASQEANQLFENLFEVNISLQTFNPNLKTSAKYFVNELCVFDGVLQLLKVNKNDKTGEVVYECSLLGELRSLFTEIEGEFLTDLYNYSTYTFFQPYVNYNHSLTGTNVINSWSNLSSYVYPLIDWGVNNSNLSFVKPQHLRACLPVKGYLGRIFEQAGYTWTSSFLGDFGSFNGANFFDRLIIPPVDFPKLSDTAITNNKFLALTDGSQVVTKTLTFGNTNQLSFSENTFTTIEYPYDTSLNGGYDAGNHFNTTTFIYTPSVTNQYTMQGTATLSFVIKRNGVDVTNQCFGLNGYISVSILQGAALVATQSLDVVSLQLGSSNSNAVTINLQNVTLTAGQQYTVKIRISSVTFVTVSSNIGSPTWTLETSITSGTFASQFATDNVYEGVTVDMIDIIPPNIKQTDFVKSIFQMFNLYATVDKTNPFNYIIEPREDFYYAFNNALDWTYKHDENSNTEIIPVGELNANKYIFTYKRDGDFLNKLYQDEFDEAYGTHEEFIENDFTKGEVKIEPIFSPTPYVGNPYFGLVSAGVYKKENNVITPNKGNIRILYWSGSINLPNTQWTFVTNLGNFVYTTYPHAGHTNTPYAPTIDINWGFPNKVYYTYPNQTWTNNNLYNKYYSKYINQITDKDSKVVITDFYLNETDIANFDFRKPIYYVDSKTNNGAYYYVNKIIDYNPLTEKPTRVELLKLSDESAFSPTISEFNGGFGSENLSHERQINNTLTLSPETNNWSENSIIAGGFGNFIAPNSENVTLINASGVVVDSQVNSFLGVGLENEEITEEQNNSSNFYNVLRVSASGVEAVKERWITVTSDFTVDGTYSGYYIDASSNDITMTVDIAAMQDKSFNIVRTDASSNLVYIDATSVYGTENFIGQSLPYNLELVQYEAVPLITNLDTIYIKG